MGLFPTVSRSHFLSVTVQLSEAPYEMKIRVRLIGIAENICKGINARVKYAENHENQKLPISTQTQQDTLLSLSSNY
jgi:hypothetical protein